MFIQRSHPLATHFVYTLDAIECAIILPPPLTAARMPIPNVIGEAASRRAQSSFVTLKKGGQGAGNVASLNALKHQRRGVDSLL
jgi:hypothetical protein